MTIEQVLAEKLTAGTDASITDGADAAERFMRWMYAELKEPGRKRTCPENS